MRQRQRRARRGPWHHLGPDNPVPSSTSGREPPARARGAGRGRRQATQGGREAEVRRDACTGEAELPVRTEPSRPRPSAAGRGAELRGRAALGAPYTEARTAAAGFSPSISSKTPEMASSPPRFTPEAASVVDVAWTVGPTLRDNSPGHSSRSATCPGGLSPACPVPLNSPANGVRHVMPRVQPYWGTGRVNRLPGVRACVRPVASTAEAQRGRVGRPRSSRVFPALSGCGHPPPPHRTKSWWVGGAAALPSVRSHVGGHRSPGGWP